jgi:PhnB protein
MMQVGPYLTFDGQCEAAFTCYEECLGGKILMMMTYGDSPMAEQAPPDWRQKILHASLAVGDQVLGGADAPPGRYQKPQGFSVALSLSDAEEADRIFKTLAENGSVQMPLQETFWALRFGMLVDRFGTPWMINCGKPT